MKTATRIAPKLVERVWGTTQLAPYYPNSSEKIGEAWFLPAPDYPVLVKFIFTSERLSVQVHPDDLYASKHEGSRGKTEMWHVLAAEPGSSIAIGFKASVTKADLRDAIENGSVEDLLNWVPVAPGDSYFTRAGVVHAIGGGLILCEIQQNSDVTYRLYDYGRGRELHLEKGLEVSETEPYDGVCRYPVTCDHFETELIEGGDYPQLPPVAKDHLLIAISGESMWNSQPFRAGEVLHVPAGADPVLLTDTQNLRLLRVGCQS